mgnify:CR=1 FL=1
MPHLTCEKLSFSYPESPAKTIKEISFKVPAGSFCTLCGPTGSGKSTLLRMLKPELCPNGTLTGKRTIFERDIASFAPEESASLIGYVMQNPVAQIVTDSVWHELAFGLENLGVPTQEIRRRVAETAQYFGIQSWFNKKTSELSGGQKQTLNLASIMVMQPKTLVLDEPTSNLDPRAKRNMSELLEHLDITLLIATHDMELAWNMCDTAIVLDEGRIVCMGDAHGIMRNEKLMLEHGLEVPPSARCQQ